MITVRAVSFSKFKTEDAVGTIELDQNCSRYLFGGDLCERFMRLEAHEISAWMRGTASCLRSIYIGKRGISSVPHNEKLSLDVHEALVADAIRRALLKKNSLGAVGNAAGRWLDYFEARGLPTVEYSYLQRDWSSTNGNDDSVTTEESPTYEGAWS